MNKQRRAAIKEVCSKLEVVKDELNDILSDEQDAYDNIPESLIDSDKAEESGEAIDTIETAVDDLESAIENLIELL